jgi:hypothetical protein
MLSNKGGIVVIDELETAYGQEDRDRQQNDGRDGEWKPQGSAR